MNIDLKEQVIFPFKGNQWWLKFLIGWAIYLFPTYTCTYMVTPMSWFLKLLVLVASLASSVVMAGYLFQVLHEAREKKEEVPAWSNWPLLFQNGLKIFAIILGHSLAYGLIAFLVYLLFKIPILGSLFSLLKVGIGLLSVVGVPYILIVLLRYSETQDMSIVFDVIRNFNLLKSNWIEYLTVMIFIIGLHHIIDVCFGINFYYRSLGTALWSQQGMSFPLVLLLAPFATFWLSIVTCRSIGLLYAQGQALHSEGSAEK